MEGPIHLFLHDLRHRIVSRDPDWVEYIWTTIFFPVAVTIMHLRPGGLILLIILCYTSHVIAFVILGLNYSLQFGSSCFLFRNRSLRYGIEKWPGGTMCVFLSFFLCLRASQAHSTCVEALSGQAAFERKSLRLREGAGAKSLGDPKQTNEKGHVATRIVYLKRFSLFLFFLLYFISLSSSTRCGVWDNRQCLANHWHACV